MADTGVLFENDPLLPGSAPEDKVPPEWSRMLSIHATKIRRVVIEWQRGAGAYQIMPGAAVEYPELVASKDAPAADQRQADPTTWGREVARERWAACVAWARKHGPVISVRCSGLAWNDKAGALQPIRGCVASCRCTATGEGGEWADAPATTNEAVIRNLLIAMDKRDDKFLDAMDRFNSMGEKIGGVLTVVLAAAESAIKMKDSVSAAAIEDRRADREFLLNLARTELWSRSIGDGIREAGPIIRDAFAHFGVGHRGPTSAELAQSILSELDDLQRAKIKQAGFADLLADIESTLRKIAAGVSRDELVGIMTSIAPRLAAAQVPLAPLFTDKQRDAVHALLKEAGLV